MDLLDQLLQARTDYEKAQATIRETHLRASAGEIPYDEALATVREQIDIQVAAQEFAEEHTSIIDWSRW